MFSSPPWASAELHYDAPMVPTGRQCVVCGSITVNKFVEFCFSHFRPVSLAGVIAEKRALLAHLQGEPEALQRKSCIATVLGELAQLQLAHDDAAEASEPTKIPEPAEPDVEPPSLQGPCADGQGKAPDAQGTAHEFAQGPPESPDALGKAPDVVSKQYAQQLWQEAESGRTRSGVPLDGEQRLIRTKKLRQRAMAMLARYRTAELPRIAELESRVAGHLVAATNDFKGHVDAAVEPLIARAEGRTPPRREGQTASERMQEIDQVLVATRLLRKERKRLVEEERAAAREARPKRRRARRFARSKIELEHCMIQF